MKLPSRFLLIGLPFIFGLNGSVEGTCMKSCLTTSPCRYGLPNDEECVAISDPSEPKCVVTCMNDDRTMEDKKYPQVFSAIPFINEFDDETISKGNRYSGILSKILRGLQFNDVNGEYKQGANFNDLKDVILSEMVRINDGAKNSRKLIISNNDRPYARGRPNRQMLEHFINRICDDCLENGVTIRKIYRTNNPDVSENISGDDTVNLFLQEEHSDNSYNRQNRVKRMVKVGAGAEGEFQAAGKIGIGLGPEGIITTGKGGAMGKIKASVGSSLGPDSFGIGAGLGGEASGATMGGFEGSLGAGGAKLTAHGTGSGSSELYGGGYGNILGKKLGAGSRVKSSGAFEGKVGASGKFTSGGLEVKTVGKGSAVGGLENEYGVDLGFFKKGGSGALLGTASGLGGLNANLGLGGITGDAAAEGKANLIGAAEGPLLSGNLAADATGQIGAGLEADKIYAAGKGASKANIEGKLLSIIGGKSDVSATGGFTGEIGGTRGLVGFAEGESKGKFDTNIGSFDSKGLSEKLLTKA